MGNYNIIISPDREDMARIVTEFWRFRYNCLPMGMCAYGYIFQYNVDGYIIDVSFDAPDITK